MQRVLLAALAALCLSSSAYAAEPLAAVQSKSSPPPLTDFLKKDAFTTIKISPTGEYLAAIVPQADLSSLVVLRRSDLSMTGHVTLPANAIIADFRWVKDNRVLYRIAIAKGDLVAPQPTGQIFGINADGSGNGMLGWGAVIDIAGKDEKEVLIAGSLLYASDVSRMNVDNGNSRRVAEVPIRGAHFLADAAGIVRFAVGEGDDRNVKTYYRSGANTVWELINDETTTQIKVEPEGFSADGKTAYLQVEEASGPDGIYVFDTATRKRTLLYRDAVASPAQYLYSPEDRSVYAVVFQDGKPNVHYLDPDNRYATQLRAVQASFGDAMVLPTSYTKDGALALYDVYSDRIPSDFYLFDRAANSETFVASRASWFKPAMLSEMRPISFKARDGMQIPGLLTIPRGSDGKNLPLVINPHGGPFGIFDVWGFNSEVQLLASRGYAVLQVNFRGSGGYGRAFEAAGYKQWGGAMQDDLTDATHWAIDQGIADPKRICIYGASYGGYAALEGAAKEPSLYRCAVGYVGLYDLPAHFRLSDTSRSWSGRNYLREDIGEAGLEAVSPTHLANRITASVMMAAGSEDKRVTATQTEMMRDALVKAGKPPEVKIYSGEGHGLYTEADRTDLYTRLLDFLDRNMGPSAAQSVPASENH